MDMFKSIGPGELKVADSGEVEAVIATFNTIDKDGDVTRKGFFGEQPAAIVWAHDWSSPVGKGTVFETDVDARFRGSFFLNTAKGREAFETVKAMGDMQEWSYGFDILPGGFEKGDFDGRPVRFLQAGKDGGPGAKVYEVSPVLVGAGEGTRTVGLKDALPTHSTDTSDAPWDAAKVVAALPSEAAALRRVMAWMDPNGDPDAKSSYKFPHHFTDGTASTKACIAGIAVLNGARGGADIPAADRPGVYRHLARHLRDADMEPPELKAAMPGLMKFSEQLDLVVEAVKAATLRAKEIAALRAQENKQIGEESRLLLSELSERLYAAKESLDELLADAPATDTSTTNSLAAEFARWQELVYRHTVH